MYAHCLLLAAVIFSAFPPSAHDQRGTAPTSGVTIVERLRSELLAVLGYEAGAAEDVSLAERFDPYLTRVDSARVIYAESSGEVYSAKRAIEKPAGLASPHSTFRRASNCWWLWLLSGVDVCSYDPARKP